MLGIEAIANVSTTAVTKDSITLSNGRELQHKYAIVIPPFTGVQAILDSPGLGDARGFVPVNDRYQHETYPNIYAAGVASQVKPPVPTEVPTGVPKTGWMAEVMAKVAAHNIAAAISGDGARGEAVRRHRAAVHHGRRQPGHDHRARQGVQAAKLRGHAARGRGRTGRSWASSTTT